jgi:hypothetical protein
MQEPLENLSENARLVHADLDAHPEETRQAEEIASSIGGQLTLGEVVDALRELEAANRAAESFGGWSVLR